MQRAAARGAVVTMDAQGAWLSVRGHKGIVEYGARVLRLRLNKGVLRIEGEGLMLESMDGEDVLIGGRVDQVTVERG